MTSGKLLLIALFCLAVCAMPALADTLKDGTIQYSAGHKNADQPIPLGYDPWGYNYQAHMFSGSYFNAYAGGAGFDPYDGEGAEYDAAYLAANPGAASHWAWPYREVDLQMKWNDAWLSNQDQDGDHKLDRHYGLPGYIGSGAWLTNHQSSSYEVNVNGKTNGYHWTDFVKIVAVPSTAYQAGAIWYGDNDVEIGSDIWGEFAVVQEVYNDPMVGVHGPLYISPFGPGFGQYGPQ